MSSIQNEDILDELDDLFEKINQIVADHESVDLDFYLKQSNYSLRKAKGVIEAMIAKAENRARIDALKDVVRNSNIELMDPRKPFRWGPDTWTQQVPVVPRILIDEKIATLSDHHLPEDPSEESAEPTERK